MRQNRGDSGGLKSPHTQHLLLDDMMFVVASTILVFLLICDDGKESSTSFGAMASAVAAPVTTTRSRRSIIGSTREGSLAVVSSTATSTMTTVVPPPSLDDEVDYKDDKIEEQLTVSSSSSSNNPLVQLVNYVKDTAVNFKNGLVELNMAHKRCNAIRNKQTMYAKTNLGISRPRGLKGVQIGGITYEEYDYLRKGLVDRNKLLAVIMVSLALPNYFVYYLWTFPDMMPGPFMKSNFISRADAANELSRKRCHAVISVMLDMEKGARIAPWSAKLNPFGRKATERSMTRLGDLVNAGCTLMSSSMTESEREHNTKPTGGMVVVQRLSPLLYSSSPFTKKQQSLLDGKILPKQIIKGLTSAINADPISKCAAPFGIGFIQHIDSVTLADEFIVNQGISVDEINSKLLEEACSARLIGGPRWSDEERKVALSAWLEEVEIKPRRKIMMSTMKDDQEEGDDDDSNNSVAAPKEQQQQLYYNGNLARAVLMCYNAVDGTRDTRSDSKLLRFMYQRS